MTRNRPGRTVVKKQQILYHLDDDPFYLEELRDKLLSHNNEMEVYSFTSYRDFLKALKPHDAQVVAVLDINLHEGEMNGQQLVAKIRSQYQDLIIMMCSDLNDPETVSQSLAWGADDFIFKGMDESSLIHHINSLCEYRSNNTQPQYPHQATRFETSSIARIKERIPRIINSAITAVHVHGESGTGKEYVSELFEQTLPPNTPFNRIHCGAISPHLLESELFGHIKGSFTGATTNKRGLIEQADGGWIFLDEVATLSPPAQVALLRVLENQQIRPVGASQEKKVDIRIISATNESLTRLVEQGKFRADLWQRLCEATIELLPLRERMDEFPSIIQYFCNQMNFGPYTITPGTLKLLMQYDWRKGNIRELRNCLRAMTEGAINKTLTPAAIPKHIWQAINPQNPPTVENRTDEMLAIPLSKNPSSYEYLCQLLLAKLIRHHVKKQGPMSVRQLASALNMPRSTLGTHIKKLKDNSVLNSEEASTLFKI